MLAETQRVRLEIAETWQKHKLELKFKFTPTKGLKLNLEAPWQLKVGTKGSDFFALKILTRKEWNKDLPGFVVSEKIMIKEFQIPYEWIAFSCTEDKSQCFRETLKGHFVWPKPKTVTSQ